MFSFSDIAWAQDTGTQGGGQTGGLTGLLQGPIPMMILIFVIFYFLLIRPQQKKAKEHKQMLGDLKRETRLSHQAEYTVLLKLSAQPQ